MKPLSLLILVICLLFTIHLPVSASSEPAVYDLLLEPQPANTAGGTDVEELEPSADDLASTDPHGAMEHPITDAPADPGQSSADAAGTLYEPGDPLPAFHGAPGRGSMQSPDKYWASNGYPDDVSFVYESGGELLEDGTVLSYWEIGLVNADENRRSELLDWLAPTCLVTFVDCLYPYSERETAFQALASMEDSRIQHCTMGLNTEFVYVWAAPSDAANLQTELHATYGELVVVLDEMAICDESTLTTGTGLDMGSGMTSGSIGSGLNSSGESPHAIASDQSVCFALLLLLVLALVLAGLSAILLHRVRRVAAQTTAGSIDSLVRSPSRREIAQAIRLSGQPPSESVWEKILVQVEKPSKYPSEL